MKEANDRGTDGLSLWAQCGHGPAEQGRSCL